MEKEQDTKINEAMNDEIKSSQDLNNNQEKNTTKENEEDIDKEENIKISNEEDIDKEENIKISNEEKIKELEDKLARTFAEMENQRRRFEKEKDEAFEYGGFSFARESLNLIDNFDRTKQSLEGDEKIKDSDALKITLEHLDIVKKDLISIFKKNNIEEINSIDKKLDPNLHQAMMEIEDDNKEPGTIVQEIQKGFTMKERLLRPSLVAVSKKINKNQEKTEKKDNK